MGTEISTPPFSVKPEVVALEELFEEIKRGQLRSPKFQRSFVWRPEDMRRLFESVVKGYPIGSLLIWEPGVRYECLSHFGPIEQGEPRADQSDLAYVLDGQHRLATLFGATHVQGPPPEDAGNRHWWMWFDLETEEFTHSPRGGVGPTHLPLRDLLGTTQFLRFCSTLLTARPGDGPTLVERAERLLRLIRVYKIPVVRIRGGRLEDSVDIFSRLNSSGVPMAADQMVSALTYREGEGAFDLASRITDILEDLAALNFGGIDRSAVLRTIAGVAGIKIHGKPGQQVANFLLAEQFTPESRELLVQKASTGLVGAAEWLVERGVHCARLLPYALQIVMLAQFFGERPPSAKESKMLESWLFATSFSGWFAGGNTTQINEDLSEMDRFQREEIPELAALSARARPFPERYDSRSARVRAFLVATLVRLGPLRGVGDSVDVVSLFPTDDIVAVPKVFPRAPRRLASAPANRILLPTDPRRGVRRQLIELANECSPEDFQLILRSHAINSDAYFSLLIDDAESFVAARTKHLIEIERELMQDLGLLLPEREIEDSLLDADT